MKAKILFTTTAKLFPIDSLFAQPANERGRYVKTAFIPLFLFAALLCGVTNVQAQSSGNVNENITWTFADGTLTLSGTGPMPNYGSLSDVPWYNNYSLAITKVEIGAGITTIGSYAFGDLPYLTSVTIPNGITSIGEYAFQGCNNLTTITLPEDLLTIGGYAFYGCTALTSITIPGSVTSIGMWAFGLCISLPSITLPEGLLTIGDGAFDYCSQLVSLNIPPNITNIGFGTFADCSKLASITLPEGVVTVGNFAFQRCSALATIRVLSATPPAAGNLAFNLLDRASCKLIVPSGAKAAYQAAAYWQGFTNISEVEYSGTTGPLSWILTSDGTLVISGKGDMPVYTNYPNSPYSPWYAYRASIKTVVIEEGVTSIGDFAFADYFPPFYAALTQVSIPSSVTRIGRDAFSYCRALASVTIPAGVTSIGFYAFHNTAITSVTIPAGITRIENGVFSNCSNLASITFLGNITSIRATAFNNTGFTSFTIPGSVTSIEQYTFQNCKKLTSITIPNSVTSIGEDAFKLCTALTTVTIGNGITYWGLERNAFSNCTALTTVRIFTLTPPSLDYKNDVFWYIDPACVLEVPSESKNLYMAAAGWKEFATINGIVDPDLASSVVSASIASSTSITINGTITNSSSEAKNSAGYYCAYGTDPNNLNQNTATQYGTVPASGSLNVSTTITGLTNGTLYYYKLVAVGNRSALSKIFLSNPIPTSNLKLWLRADMAVTSASSAVSAWGDLSGWNNDASQGTSGNQPTVAEGAINAKPALSFNGTTSKLTLPTSTSLGLQSTPYEMFIVAKSSSGNVQFLIAGGANEQFEYHLNGAAGARFIPTTSAYIDKSTTGSYTNGSAHLFSARAAVTGGAVRVDGIDGVTSGSNILSSNSSNLLLGVRSDGTYYFNGDIAEVIIYNRTLTYAERNSVEQYLDNRYQTDYNQKPEFTSTSFTEAEDMLLARLLATDVEGDLLSYTILSNGQNGTAYTQHDSLFYMPAPDFYGNDSLHITVSDGLLSDTAWVYITVTPVNDAPVLRDLLAATVEEDGLFSDMLATDVEGDLLSYSILSNGQNGTANTQHDSLFYMPAPDFNGRDSLHITVNDGLLSDTAWVYITVTPVNDAPVLRDLKAATVEEDGLFSDILANDVEGDLLSYSILSNGHNGTAYTQHDSLFYMPAPDFNGSDSLHITVNDGLLSDTAWVYITVTPVNDAPVARDTLVEATVATATTINLPVSDIDGTISAVFIHREPVTGAATVSGNSLSYTSDSGFSGNDTIAWYAQDNEGAFSDTVKLVIHVNPSEIAVDLSVSDTTVVDGTTACFNAENEITIAGSSTVIVENNATANFIAGTSIRFLPGFHAVAGSNVHGWITTDGSFCDGASGAIVENQQIEKSGDAGATRPAVDEQGSVMQLKVYPNPNNGRFIVEVIKSEIETEVEVYNALGEKVYRAMLDNDKKSIDLSGIRRGLYVVMVTDGKDRVSRKVMVE